MASPRDSVGGGAVAPSARDAAGTIVGAAAGYIDTLPAGGSAQFEAYFDSPLPPETTYDTYVMTY